MPSDVRLLGASRRLPVLHLRARVNRRPFRSLIVLLSLAAVAWRLASGLRPNPDDDADDALGSGSPSIWADLREWRRPAAGRPAPPPSPPSMEPRWAELGLQETAAGLVVLPALAPGDVLERHPVELLIEAAEAKARQQAAERPKTLDGAVAQYRALFAAEPPLGFDKWFASFDPPPAILPKAREAIVPFLAFSGQTLRERTDRLDGARQTFSLDFRGGKIAAVEGTQAKNFRADEHVMLLSPLAEYIPDVKVYFNVDDGPRFVARFPVRNASTHYGSRNEIWPEEERAALEDHQQGVSGYHWACSTDSPVGRLTRDQVLTAEGGRTAESRKSFIWDHAKAMDYCLAPELHEEHSLFMYGRPAPAILTPMFSYSRTAHNTDLFGVPLDNFFADVALVPWAEKTIPKVYWRGSGTGVSQVKSVNWRLTQRYRLYSLSHPSSDEAARPLSILAPSTDGRGWTRETRQTGSLVEELLDIELVGQPLGCGASNDVLCDEMKAEVTYSKLTNAAEALKYQFVIDVDGNGWSSRFRRLLLGGSVVFKATVFPEWFSDALIPFYHYVPVQNSYADLFDLVAFFKARPELAQAIGDNGRRFVLESWSWESMQAYYLLALLEYARALADDREAMTLVYP